MSLNRHSLCWQEPIVCTRFWCLLGNMPRQCIHSPFCLLLLPLWCLITVVYSGVPVCSLAALFRLFLYIFSAWFSNSTVVSSDSFVPVPFTKSGNTRTWHDMTYGCWCVRGHLVNSVCHVGHFTRLVYHLISLVFDLQLHLVVVTFRTL